MSKLTLQPSFTLVAKQLKIIRHDEGLPVYDGGLGENPLTIPKSMVDSVIRYSNLGSYTDTKGKQLIQDLIGPNLLIGNGLKPLLYCCQKSFGLLFPDKTIFHIVPGWVSYMGQTNTLPKQSVLINCSRESNWKLTPEILRPHLEASSKGSLIVFNNPTNPTGQIYTVDEIASLVKLFREFETIVLYDSIYAGLVYSPYEKDFGHIDQLYPEGVIIGNSLSKLFASGGYRFGWLKFPDVMKDENNMLQLFNQCHCFASITYSCPSEMFQHVCATALTYPEDVRNQIEFQKKMFWDVSKKVFNILESTDLITSYPQAAWYIWIDFSNYCDKLEKRGIVNSIQLAKSLCEDIGLIIVPGYPFGMDIETLTIRYSFVDIKEIDPIKSSYDDKLIGEGLNKLKEWLDC